MRRTGRPGWRISTGARAREALSGDCRRSRLHLCRGVTPRAARQFAAQAHNRAVSTAPHHVLYLILDEHLGIAGFPSDIPACAEAASAVSAVLAVHNFTVYPNAYSNYPVTVDSLPSVLNRTVLAHSRQMIRQTEAGSRVYSLSANRLVADMRAAGRDVVVVQHRSFDLNAGAEATRVEYEDVAGDLQSVEGSWLEKMQWVVGAYQASDPALLRVNRFFPFRLGQRITGPLAVRRAWPARLADGIESARKPTLFLAHLTAPHGPYLYRRDGTVRPMAEWSGDRADRRLAPAVYSGRYMRYCEQVSYLSAQLNGFLAKLQRAGMLEAMTVVIHGDHGSRIRAAFDGLPGDAHAVYPPERFDYPHEPDLRDLLNRFSTLMAIKRAAQSAPVVHPAKESLLRILERDFYRGVPAAGADSVYLFSAIGESRAIALLNFWK